LHPNAVGGRFLNEALFDYTIITVALGGVYSVAFIKEVRS